MILFWYCSRAWEKGQNSDGLHLLYQTVLALSLDQLESELHHSLAEGKQTWKNQGVA